jgi:hypothetical protein
VPATSAANRPLPNCDHNILAEGCPGVGLPNRSSLPSDLRRGARRASVVNARASLTDEPRPGPYLNVTPGRGRRDRRHRAARDYVLACRLMHCGMTSGRCWRPAGERSAPWWSAIRLAPILRRVGGAGAAADGQRLTGQSLSLDAAVANDRAVGNRRLWVRWMANRTKPSSRAGEPAAGRLRLQPRRPRRAFRPWLERRPTGSTHAVIPGS